jgi:hypothetical protein
VSLLERIARLCEPGRVRVYPRAVFAMFFALWIGSYALMRESAIVDGWGRFLGNDFMAFYTGAKLWMAGAPDLYDLDAQTSYQIAMAGRELGSVIPFISPPPALWLYLPFAQGGSHGGPSSSAPPSPPQPSCAASSPTSPHASAPPRWPPSASAPCPRCSG